MKLHKFTTCLIVALACLATAPLRGADRVRLLAGGQSSGKLTSISPTELKLEVGANTKTIAVNEVDTVQFDGEPNELTQARNALNAGKYEAAAGLLAKVATADIGRAEIAQDVEFYKALAAARLALAGSGSKADAGKRLFSFEKAHRESFHYYETCELLGDLLVALGKYADAETFYGKLADAPWPEYKSRAAVLLGQSLVQRKQFDLALAQFDEALKATGAGDAFDRQQLSAKLGRAAALAGAGKTDEAVQLVGQIIEKANPENYELQASAYNVLGQCHQAAGKTKEALLAYLHVDLLYARVGPAHAEALANLAKLWTQLEKPERADQARSRLKEKYPESKWAQEL